jgi:hypothetical protein
MCDRTDKEEPKCVYATTDIFSTSHRQAPESDMDDPKRAKCRSESELPIPEKSNNERSRPKRASFRKDNVDPAEVNLHMETLWAMRVDCRRDNDELRDAKRSTEISPRMRAVERTLHVDPRCTKAKTDR